MGYSSNQSVSKPLLITLVVVALAGAIFFAMRAAGGGGADEKVDIPPVPENMPPAQPQPGEPGATGIR